MPNGVQDGQYKITDLAQKTDKILKMNMKSIII